RRGRPDDATPIVTPIVTTASVFVRSQPAATAARVAQLEKWTRVEIVETSPDGAWHKIAHDGKDVGYVTVDAVAPEKMPTEIEVAPITQPSLMTRRAIVIRAAPTIESTRLTVLPEGRRLVVNSQVNDGEWYRLARNQGYMQGRFLVTEAAER
ncbi:MAG: SH3 domain-containing protein, partial [Alphaproteobacteria bacterium]|nr:SH3 domain-containing protein [Alphaproteobacteria bacterium]